jgi:hypothetical protein
LLRPPPAELDPANSQVVRSHRSHVRPQFRAAIDAITQGVKDQQLVLTPELVVRNSTAPASATRSKRV